MSKHYLLIGASAASIGALNALRRFDPAAKITIISAETEVPYNKCLLADYVAGSIQKERLSICSMQQDTITWVLGKKIIKIDSDGKKVHAADGTVYAYDKLFLGLGSSPWMPDLPGIKSKGIFTFHTYADTNALLDYVKNHGVKNVAIIGAGLSGLEVADALLKHSLHITLIEKNDQVLPWLLSSNAAQFLHRKILEQGVQLLLNQSVVGFADFDGSVKHVQLKDGQMITADMVIVATGLRANTYVCHEAGIAVGQHGIVVNEYLQTSVDHIYAGGDLIAVKDLLTGNQIRSCLWPDAMHHGMIAAYAMVGKPKPYAGTHIITSSAFFGIKFARAGSVEPHDADAHIQRQSNNDFCHSFTVIDGRLKGFEVLGTRHNLGDLRRILLQQQPITIDQITFFVQSL